MAMTTFLKFSLQLGSDLSTKASLDVVSSSASVTYADASLPFSNLQFLTKVVAYRRSKTTENTKRSASKVVAVAYERWSLTRGFTNSNLTEEPIGNFDSGRLREAVAQGGSTVSSNLHIFFLLASYVPFFNQVRAA